MVVAGSILKGQCIPYVINQNLDNLKKMRERERERERERACMNASIRTYDMT